VLGIQRLTAERWIVQAIVRDAPLALASDPAMELENSLP
jgi:hypothetical protein